MEDKRNKGYKRLDGDDSLRHIPQVLNSIMSGGAGDPSRIQCLVQDSNGFNYRINDIVFDNGQRCVKLHIDEAQPIDKPDYAPDGDGGNMLFKQREKSRPI